MEQVVLLTEEQKNQIENQKYTIDVYFWPQQDVDQNWFITTVEQELCTHPDFDWIKRCPLIEYKPKPMPTPFEQE